MFCKLKYNFFFVKNYFNQSRQTTMKTIKHLAIFLLSIFIISCGKDENNKSECEPITDVGIITEMFDIKYDVDYNDKKELASKLNSFFNSIINKKLYFGSGVLEDTTIGYFEDSYIFHSKMVEGLSLEPRIDWVWNEEQGWHDGYPTLDIFENEYPKNYILIKSFEPLTEKNITLLGNSEAVIQIIMEKEHKLHHYNSFENNLYDKYYIDKTTKCLHVFSMTWY